MRDFKATAWKRKQINSMKRSEQIRQIFEHHREREGDSLSPTRLLKWRQEEIIKMVEELENDSKRAPSQLERFCVFLGKRGVLDSMFTNEHLIKEFFKT